MVRKCDVQEAVIQEDVRAVQERRLRVETYRYGVTSAVDPMCLLRITQVGKFSVKTMS